MKAKSKKWMIFFIMGYILICLCGELAHAQENWVYIYEPSTDYNDYFNDVRQSPYDGYIYCAGLNWRNSVETRMCLFKLDPATGNKVWHRFFNPPGADYDGVAYEIDFDGAGNIYVAGAVKQLSSNGGWGFVIIKYDPAGTLLDYHITQYSGSRQDKAYSVDVGSDNMVYVAGYLTDSDNERDYVVRKYDTSLTYTGCMLRYDYSSYHCTARRVRVDSDLNVWSCGTARISPGANLDFIVVKCDTSLTQTGLYCKNGAGNSTDYAYDLCLPWSGTGGVHACGYLYNGSGPNKDFVVVKLDANCNEEWLYTYDNPNNGEDIAYRVVNGHAATCVAGYIRGSSGNDEDYTIICLWGSEEAWVYTYNGTGNSTDEARDITFDSSGHFVYAAGHVWNTGREYDFIVTKHYYTQATPIWEYIYDGPANENDKIYSIDISPDGNLYVGGNIEKDSPFYEAGAISLPQNFPPTIPALISPANGDYLNDTTVIFIWHASEDPETSVQNYILQYDIDPAFGNPDSFVLVDTVKTTILVNDTIYYWRVKARDTDGNDCKWSSVRSFSIDLTPPDSPVLLSPIGGAILLDTLVTFEWGEVTFMGGPPAPVQYVLQIDTDYGFPDPVVEDTFNVDTTTVILSGDERYYWRIKAYDLAGNEGSYSDTASFLVDISGSSIDSTTVWPDTSFSGPFGIYTKVTDLSGVDSVVLWFKRMEDPGWFPREMLEGSSDDIYFKEIPQVTMPNDTVKYYIYTKDNAGHVSTDPSGAPENYYWFIAGYDPGVMDFDTPTLFSFGLKNNPTKGNAIFNLSLPEAAIVTLRIYDVSGRLIDSPVSGRKSAGYYEIPWTLETTAGVYFYSFESPWKNEVGKLILVR